MPLRKIWGSIGVYGIYEMARLIFSGCVNADVVRKENPKLQSQHGPHEAEYGKFIAVK